MEHRVIRVGVFETNSSSTHSISIASGDYIVDSLTVVGGVVTVFPGEFGWEVKDYHDAPTKASYCLTWLKGLESCQDRYKKVLTKAPSDPERKELMKRIYETKDARRLPQMFDMFKDVICEATGASSVEFHNTGDKYFDWGYIDHQSDSVCAEAFESKTTLRDFIFNPSSELHTDNDNR